MIKSLIVSLLSLFVLALVGTTAVADTKTEYGVITVADGFDAPWAFAFLPNSDFLVTERKGVIKIVRDGKVLGRTISGVPEVYLAGQGGLLDIMLDQNFADNQKLYLSFAHGDADQNATRLVSARLVDDALVDTQVLFTASPMKSTAHHYAGRLAQLQDGSLLLTVGDGFNYREQAQVLDSHLGKIIRIDQQGRAPADNPYRTQADAKPEIWSIGHRNHQGLVVVNGVVYEHEHGAQGGDEINIIKPGMNYGWPVITRGIDYNGAQITPFDEYEGMLQPLVDWTPSIAPSGMAYHNGDLYVTSLAEGSIRRVTIDGDTLTDQGIVFPELRERLRDIESGPDGDLYVLTDGTPARLLRITQSEE